MVVPFTTGFGKVLVSAGFRREGSKTWVRELDEIIEVVDLQKSQYGASYYVNLGAILKEIWPSDVKPTTRQSHLVSRLDTDGMPNVVALLEHPRDLDDRDLDVLHQELASRVESFFQRFNSSEKLRLYALSIENIVPIPKRELRDWAGFDYSVWNKK